MIRALFTVLLAAAASGCIHHRAGPAVPAGNGKTGWTAGVTTRRDVVSAWGNPHATKGNTWIWRTRTAKGGKVKAAYYMIGVTVAHSAVTTREHRLEFGENGTLVAHESADLASDAGDWTLWPW